MNNKYFYFLLIGIIIITGIIISSCHEEKLILKKWDVYEIKKGEHYSSGVHFGQYLSRQEMCFDAIFDESAIYKTIDPNNQTDINKLFGFSDCNSGHHKNSARFGWNWNDSLSIYAYCYAHGKANHKFISCVKPNEINRYMIKIEKEKYIFYLAGKEIEMRRGCDCGAGYLLFPFFGGSEKSNQDIKIKLKYLS